MPIAATAIGPEGGVVSKAEGTVSLTFPPGAVRDYVTPNIRPATGFPEHPLVVPGTVYEFLPPNLRFNKPVLLVIEYDPTVLPPGVRSNELNVFQVLDGVWQETAAVAPGAVRIQQTLMAGRQHLGEDLTVERDTVTDAVAAWIDGFGTYGVLGVSVASLDLEPAEAELRVGDGVILSATVKDASGNVLPQRAVAWSTTDSAVAWAGPNGAVTAVGAGTVDVIAAAEGVPDTARVTVLEPVARLVVTPPNATLRPGEAIQLSAVAVDADDNVLPDRPMTWSSSDPTVATVDPSGLVTAMAAGTTAITATSESRVGTAVITVLEPVASVGLRPTDVTLVVGETTQLTAAARDGEGEALPGRSVTWSSSGDAVATVDSTGLVTAVRVGSATVLAQSEGQVSNPATIKVVKPVTTVDITPRAATVSVGFAVQFTASTRDDAGQVLSGRSVTWLIGEPTIATIDDTGLVTGVGVGATAIAATSEGVSGVALLTVVVPVASVAVVPDARGILEGRTVQLEAELRDAAGNRLAGRVVSWASDKPDVATVDDTGLVTGVAAGTATIAAETDDQTGTATITVVRSPAELTADPTLLPLAVPNQLPDFDAYDALDLPTQASGFSYADPVTGVPVYKVSDASTPVANTSVVHDYAEFGPHISMPWIDDISGHTMYTLHVVKTPGGEGYFVDFDYQTGTLSGWRAAWGLLKGGFSSDPLTPRVGYRVADGNHFNRVNIVTGEDENIGNFPSPVFPDFDNGHQLLIDGANEWLVAQGQGATDHGISWNAVTGQTWDWGNNPPDEFRLDPAGQWIYLNRTTEAWEQASLAAGPPGTNIRTWVSDYANSHGTAAVGYLVGIDPSFSAGPRLHYYDPTTHTRTWIGAAGQVGADHLAGQWINGNLAGVQQWIVASDYNGDPPALGYRGVAFLQLNDASASNVRLLVHHYTASDKNNYFSQPHATISPDGKLVMWESEMHVSGGRIDVFLAQVPTR